MKSHQDQEKRFTEYFKETEKWVSKNKKHPCAKPIQEINDKLKKEVNDHEALKNSQQLSAKGQELATKVGQLSQNLLTVSKQLMATANPAILINDSAKFTEFSNEVSKLETKLAELKKLSVENTEKDRETLAEIIGNLTAIQNSMTKYKLSEKDKNSENWKVTVTMLESFLSYANKVNEVFEKIASTPNDHEKNLKGFKSAIDVMQAKRAAAGAPGFYNKPGNGKPLTATTTTSESKSGPRGPK